MRHFYRFPVRPARRVTDVAISVAAAVESYGLEARQAASVEPIQAQALPFDIARDIVPLNILILPGGKSIILAQDRELVSRLESLQELPAALSKHTPFDQAGYRVIPRCATTYQPDRLLYDCLAIKLPGA